MSLRRKTILIISTASIALLILVLLFSRLILIRAYENLEHDEARQDSERVLNAFRAEQNGLAVSASSWSVWDNSYIYVQDGNQKFEDDISGEALATLNYDLGIVTDNTGKPLYQFALSEDRTELVEAPAEASTIVEQPLVLALITQPYLESGELNLLSGVILIEDTPFLVGIAPILPTEPFIIDADGEEQIAPAGGVILFGKRVDSAFEETFAATARQDLRIVPYKSDLLTGKAENGIALGALNQNRLASQIIISDLQANPILLIDLSYPRPILQQGLESTIFYLVVIASLGFLLILLLLYILNWMILGRLKRLAVQVDAVRISADPSLRVEQVGEDELGRLGGNINAMLGRLAQVQEDLSISRQKAEETARLKAQFLANMSHEFRTPMNAILGYTDLLLENREQLGEEKQHDMLERIRLNSTHLLNIINELLDFSKVESGQLALHPEAIKVKTLADEVMMQTHGLALQKGLQYVIWVDPTLPSTMQGDAQRLKQILINLISNAIKFTSKGSVKVEMKSAGDQHWRIEVSDTGIGIPPEAHAIIFEEFRQVDGSLTRQHGGTGLGLAIVRNLVLLMGGSIAVHSEVGKGSTFSIQLPLIASESVPA